MDMSTANKSIVNDGLKGMKFNLLGAKIFGFYNNFDSFVFWDAFFQLDALEYIHENSYVHADIKASNCLLGYKAGKPDQDVVSMLLWLH